MTVSIEFGSGDFAASKADVLALVVTEGGFEKQRAFAHLDQALGGALAAHVATAQFKGRLDDLLDVPTLGRLGVRRILLAGAGPKRGLGTTRLRSAVATATRAAINVPSLAVVLSEIVSVPELRAVAEGVGLGAYGFTKYFTGDRAPKKPLTGVAIHLAKGHGNAGEKRAVEQGLAVASAVNLARDAVNEPPNVLTPEALAETARKIAKEGKLKVTVLDEKAIRKAGMNLHFAVGQGSANPPRLIHLTYEPKRPKATIALVGKGLTFDSGGLCIKPAPGMGDMKSDMGGAAAVLGVMAAIAAIRPNVTVHGIVAAAENMPDGNAYRPADVFTSLDGKTVEIINTDAEGRLVLADALAYTRKLEPDVMIDAATLTGACLVALGKNCSAFYTADDKLARRFAAAADDAGEQFWRMPLLEELREQLSSDIADLKHTGDRYGGSISAALFLREFVGDTPWIHCDIAGPVLSDRPKGMYPKGATGHPVLTFLSMVEAAGK
ncbi:MAG TPA: leucyl aminopeptidase [Polyangiaceae bacterium]|jgi:leucyl aminopeptidase|nr:leucyl aminopeptidase [Polyangiaceae bacterium]